MNIIEQESFGIAHKKKREKTMVKALEELKSFSSSYFEVDYLQKSKELFQLRMNQLDCLEKEEFLEFLAGRCSASLFLCFCSEAKYTFDITKAMKYAGIFCEKAKSGILYNAYQRRVRDFLLGVPEFISASDKGDYYLFALRLSIKYDCIFALQELLKEDQRLHFIKEGLVGFENEINEQQDMRIGDNVRNYLENGIVSEDWQTYVQSSKYVPDIYVDYFATQGSDICKEILKSYKKSKLLSKNTTLEELDAFVDSYNWDDGVEVPYFVMHHKNCDLALRKKLLELGAGDSIDETTYIDAKKDPWKQFILELKEMIEKEEQ